MKSANQARDEFNRGGVGQDVIVTLADGRRVHTRTRTAAVCIGHTVPAVKVCGICGWYPLSSVELVSGSTDFNGVVTPNDLIMESVGCGD